MPGVDLEGWENLRPQGDTKYAELLRAIKGEERAKNELENAILTYADAVRYTCATEAMLRG
jgi:hypothetical protein